MTSIDLVIPCGDHIVIEKRPDREMTHVGEHRIAAPGISIILRCKCTNEYYKMYFIGINCWNPAFDVTPCNLITGIITEVGVFSPHELYEKVNLIQKS